MTAARLALVLALAMLAACAAQDPTRYDLVIANGRVMDPESGLDASRHVGISGGTIAIVSEAPLAGARVIDAANHVVAPGFIDLHEHGQSEEAYGMMVRDGVTSAFELEVGTADVARWYAEREGGQIVNYGVSVGHIPVRMKVLGDPGTGLLPAGIGGSGTASDAQIAQMEAKGPSLSDWAPPTRPQRRCRRSSGCSASPQRPARRRTFTCGAVSPGSRRRSPRRAPPARRFTSSTSTRPPAGTSIGSWSRSRRRATPDRTSPPRRTRTAPA
jgi:hypothetical protein